MFQFSMGTKSMVITDYNDLVVGITTILKTSGGVTTLVPDEARENAITGSEFETTRRIVTDTSMRASTHGIPRYSWSHREQNILG